MFQLYLLLRLKNFGRIVIELGIFRIVFLTILTVAAIMILFLAENRFAIPVVCVLLLAGYHNVRKDKEFLRFNTSSFWVPDKRIHLDRITFCRNRNNKRTIYRRYRLMAVRRLITFPERNKTGTQTCPSSFSLQRKL